MASDIAVDGIIPGSEIVVHIDKTFDDILTVTTKKKSMKGLLMPVTNKNNVIFDKLLTECKELNKNFNCDRIDLNFFCVPDSTLSHNALDCTSNNSDNICTHCKKSLNKVPKSNELSKVNRELKGLANHGFNKDILKKKNDLSRRGTIIKNDKKIEVTKDALNKNMENDINGSNAKYFGTSSSTTRPTSQRALKTRANEKIIDLCSKRKSIKLKPNIIIVEGTQRVPFTVDISDEKIMDIPRISDASVYDFEDEDCETESSKLPKDNSNARIESTLKKPRRKRCSKSNFDIQSNRPIMFYEIDGVMFSLNDVVWAKIPGCPFWPAHIHAFDNVDRSKIFDKRCRIDWIGWDQRSILPLKSLVHFRDHFTKKYSPKLKSSKYKNAIGLACKELGLDLDDLVAETLLEIEKASSEKNSGSHSSYSKKKSVNLDEIFACSGGMSKSLSAMEMNQKTYSEDEDTDEEEKARSALITIESLEANTKLSGLISRVD